MKINYSLAGTWHRISVENHYDGRWNTVKTYEPAECVWQFDPAGKLYANSSHELPFIAEWSYRESGLLHIEGVNFKNGQRHSRIEEWYCIEWESNDRIVLYDCDENNLMPVRITIGRDQ